MPCSCFAWPACFGLAAVSVLLPTGRTAWLVALRGIVNWLGSASFSPAVFPGFLARVYVYVCV